VAASVFEQVELARCELQFAAATVAARRLRLDNQVSDRAGRGIAAPMQLDQSVSRAANSATEDGFTT